MNNPISTRRPRAAIAGASLLLANLSATAAVCVWTNTAGGNWSMAGNWNPNQAPGAADTAVLTNTGNYTVSLDVSPTIAGLMLGASDGVTTQTLLTAGKTFSVNGPIQVGAQGQLNVNGGTLAGTNALTGMMTWSGGGLAGNLTVLASGSLNISFGGGNAAFYGLVLTNYGTVNWTNTQLYGDNNLNAQIYNYGLWNAQSDNAFVGGNNGGSSLFENFGTFLKSGNTGATTLDGKVVFNNTGTVSVQSGALNLNGGGTGNGGAYMTSGGGNLNFTGYVFTNGNTFTGPGNYVAGGANFAGAIAGTLGWSGGGVAGNLTVASNGVFHINFGGGNAGFYGLALTNYGTINWTNTQLYGDSDLNAQIYNYGLWNAQSDNVFIGGNNGGTTLFDNFGTFLKSGNAGTTTLDSKVVFNNTGAVIVQSGTLDIGGGASDGGGFATATNSFLNFFASAYFFTNTTTFTGVGSYVAGGANFAGAIAGTLGWSGGGVAGNLTVASNGVFNINFGGGTAGFYGLALTNYGTVNWTNTQLYGDNDLNAQIYNYGLWNAQSDNQFIGGNNGGTTLFDNFGTFLKSGNAGTTTLDGRVVFNNTGVVSVQSGALSLNAGGNSGGGTFATANGALLALYNLTFANSAAITSGTTVTLGGNTTINGVLTATNLQLVGGSLSGTNVLVGTLTWLGGTLAGNLTVANGSVLNIASGGVGVGFNGLALTNYGTVTWSNAPLYGINGNNAQIYNYGLWNAQSDNAFVGGNNGGSSLFDNFGTFLKSAGTNSSASTLDAHVVFNNTGTVSVQSGALNLNGGGTGNGGAYMTSGGGNLNFTGYVFTNGNTFTGPGNYVAGGANFAGAIAGTLGWSGGGVAGNLTVASNGVFHINFGGGNAGFYGLALTNYGTVNWTNTQLYGDSDLNAQIYNYGLWNAQSDNVFIGGNNGGTTLFDNFGTFLKSGNAGTTTLDSKVVFNNTGAVIVQSGTLDIGGGASDGGGFATATNSFLNFFASAYFFTNTTTFTGGGSYVAGGANFAGAIAGTLGWSGGGVAGNLTVASNGVFNINFGGGTAGFYGLALTNYGTVNWTNTQLYGDNDLNAQIYNYGLWNAQSDNQFIGGNNGGTTLFDNFGTFLKSGNAGTTTLDGRVVFNNTGVVSVQSGALSLNAGGNSGGGTFATANGALLALYNLTFANSAAITSGTTVTLGGNTTINGVLTATNLQLVGGSLSGTNVLVGTLTWLGGTLAGNLTVANGSVLNIASGGVGVGFNGLALTNYGTVTWSNAPLYGINGNNAQIYNYGLWNARSDNAFVGGNNGGSSLFENFGTFLKSGNTGATTLDGKVVFNNTGTVSVQSGALNLNGGGTGNGGAYMTSGGGNLNFTGYVFTNGNTFTGPGNYVAGGANFAGAIAGTLGWSGGGVAGNLTVASNGVFNINFGGGNAGFYGLALTNYGTINWTNTQLYGDSDLNAQIYNYGLWNAQSDNVFIGGNNGGTTLFDNFGTFLKSGNAGTTTLDSKVVFNNTGAVIVQSGTLDIGGGASEGGGFATATNSFLNFFASAYFFTNTTTFTGVGSYVAGGANFAGAIAGTLGWSGGGVAGNLTVVSNGVFNINFGGGTAGFYGLALTNYGTVNWTNTQLYGDNNLNAQIYNYGLWDAQSDNQFIGGNNGGTTLFDNFGTFLKSGNAGTTTLDGKVVFNDSGIVDLESGTLSLNGNYNVAFNKLTIGINSPTNHGALALSGAAALGGNLNLNLNSGYVPAAGAQFQILSSGSLTGTFDTGALPVGMAIVYSKTSVTLDFNGLSQTTWAAGNAALHDTSSASFLVSPGTTVQLVASAGGVSHLLGVLTAGGPGRIAFDTTQLPNGHYTLQAIVLNGAGQVVGDFSRAAFINNSLAWHAGTLSASQTWSSNLVNAVDQDVIVPGGVTLTIAPGAIVKFNKGAGIIVQAGGTLDASGATLGAPIIFTSLADDTAGGDSNEDGDDSIPAVGDWNGINAAGQFIYNSYVQLRYLTQTHSGTLAANQEWYGLAVHLITGNIMVPPGVTLTIDPGAVIKFAPGVGLTVQAGGALNASGTFAEPITFTSLKDDSVGGDSNGDGNATQPAAGDWVGLNISGQATLNQCTLNYGGNTGSGVRASGVLIVYGSLVFSNGVVENTLYDGISVDVGGGATVVNSILRETDRAIWGYGGGHISLINCTFDQNLIGIDNHGGESIGATNCIVANSIQASLVEGAVALSHCDSWSAYTGSDNSLAEIGQNGNISADPKFVNGVQGNYELNYGSPCIDAADGNAAPPTDPTGAPRYNDPRTLVKSGIPNPAGVYPDIGAFEFIETAASPVDLIVSSVYGPLSETAGQTVTVQWNDVNIGAASAVSPWHDTLSLVPIDGGAPLVAGTVLVAQNTVLGPGQSYPASALVTVPGGLAGTYQWQVQVNSQGDVFEGINWTNNFTLSAAPTTLADPELTVGGAALDDTFTATGQSDVFAVVAPGGPFTLSVQGDSPGSALELFVGHGYVPSPSDYDFTSSQFDSAAASVTVPSTNQDTYYIVVYAAALNAPSVGYSLTAAPLGFAVDSASPASMANSGPVTLQILGAQLAANDAYSLTGPGGAFGATSVQSPDSTVAYATFNLGGATPGLYNLQVAQPAGPTLTLTNAIDAVSVSSAAAAASLSLQLESPSSYRISRPFDGTIVYRNAGEVDMPAPLLVLTSGGFAGMALQGSTNYSTANLVLLGASFEGPAGTLSPGRSWTIPFTALCASGATIPLAVNYKTADATDLVDYATLQTSLRPPGYCDATWNALWTSFQTLAGPTWGGLVSLVDSYSTRMAETNASGRFYVVRDVLTFAFAELASGGCTNGYSLAAGASSPPNLTPGPGQSVVNRQSRDPNDKFATGIGLPAWLAAGDAITYTIEFQNQPTASAPAQTVTIVDPLSTKLDWSSLQLMAVGFNNLDVEAPPGVQNYSNSVYVETDPNPVSVSASLDPATGVLTWRIMSVDPATGLLVTDPLAGFLPPDNLLGQGEGYVTYSIKPVAGLTTGAQITNQASIVFDLNAPIATPITTNTMDVTPPTSWVNSLPANSNPSFPVSWSGADVGSGVVGYDIYVSTNGGPWTPWLLNTTNLFAQFAGVYSETYAFYSVAYDAVGNVEPNPTIPGASTVVALVPLAIAPTGSGALQLSWPQGRLLQATSLAGPWTTNMATSPYTILPATGTPQMFFKVLMP